MSTNFKVYPESIESNTSKNTIKLLQKSNNGKDDTFHVKSIPVNAYINDHESESLTEYHPTSLVHNDQIYNDYVYVNPLKNTNDFTASNQQNTNKSQKSGRSTDYVHNCSSSDYFNSAIQIHKLNKKSEYGYDQECKWNASSPSTKNKNTNNNDSIKNTDMKLNSNSTSSNDHKKSSSNFSYFIYLI